VTIRGSFVCMPVIMSNTRVVHRNIDLHSNSVGGGDVRIGDDRLSRLSR
jgi:hypothetical protein